MNRATTTKWLGRSCVAALGSATLWACVTTGSNQMSQTQVAATNNAFYQEQIVLARQALERQEWDAARSNLEGMVEALPPTDPIGAEAREGFSRILFELGDYARAAQVAGEVPEGPHRARALESRGLAQLFSCDFDGATQTFYQLAQIDAPRGRVWLGMGAAWTGADANAERELLGVIEQSPTTEHGPNARFYLAQLALWRRRPGPAQRFAAQLRENSPQYLEGLDTRGQNWLTRHTHLMRAYFTFDTLARLGRMSRSPNAAAHDQRADEALRQLQATPGACAEQVQRIAQARTAGAAERSAFETATRDRDGDNVPDQSDRCPEQPETRNGLADDDGCPEETAAIDLEGNQIRIRTGFGIFFDTAADRVLPNSRPVIEQLAGLLNSPAYSWIRRIRLEGHTDDVGDDSANRSLAERRVTHVGAQLVSNGVATARFTIQSYGEARPIDPSATDEARARNRRVEIFIVDPPMFGGVRVQ